jgi:hypothetical protein
MRDTQAARLRGRGGVDASGYGSILIAGVLGGLVILMTPMTMPAVIFIGPLEPYLGLGIGLAVLSTAVTCIVLA